MPKFLLKFQAAAIKEIAIDKTPLTIGRKPDNDVVIEHMAVSGHHARLTLQGASYVIEDTQSTNGTFVNEKKIVNSALKHNDQILIGQHTLVFLQPETQAAQNVDSDATVVITPQKPPASQPSAAPQAPAASDMPAAMQAPDELPAKFPAKPELTATLRVIEGKTDQPEYVISGLLTYIGKSESSAIKLKGLFAPDIAALVSKRPTGYLITAIKDGYPKLNSKSLSGQMELNDGDIVDVGGLKLLFQLKEKKPE